MTVVAVRFLLRYLTTNRLRPFGVYCIALGAGCLIVFAL
jgi:undecaprenyl pyrophosphate phosphatase UppP